MRVWHCKRDLGKGHYVGRPTIYGNWYALEAGCPRGSTLTNYVLTLVTDPLLIARARQELAGRDLSCWCAPVGGVDIDDPLICHAQVLMRAIRGDYDDAIGKQL